MDGVFGLPDATGALQGSFGRGNSRNFCFNDRNPLAPHPSAPHTFSGAGNSVVGSAWFAAAGTIAQESCWVGPQAHGFDKRQLFRHAALCQAVCVVAAISPVEHGALFGFASRVAQFRFVRGFWLVIFNEVRQLLFVLLQHRPTVVGERCAMGQAFF
jgi:hypothetical protein